MKVLVTGGAGFIGSHYVRTMLGGGYPGFEHARVTVLDKLTSSGNLANLDVVAASPRFSFVRGDISSPRLLASVLRGQDVVVNFAAEVPGDHGRAADLVAANVTGVQALLQACLDAGVSRVVQVSTYQVYGSVPAGSSAEGAALAPDSVYAAAKAGGDLLAQAYAQAHRLDVSVTRSCSTYGPYQFPGATIPLAVTNLLQGARAPLYGDGKRVRGWVHVDDHCRGIQLVLERGQPGEIYHINGDVELTDVELTQALLANCGMGWDMVEQLEDGWGRESRYSLDDSLLRGLGYTPRTPFSRGLQATVRWYQENRRWWEPLRPYRPDRVHTLSMPAAEAAQIPQPRRRFGRRARHEPAT